MFKKRKQKILSSRALRELYLKTATHCRVPKFYLDYQIDDTLPGRFAVNVLHLFLLMNRIGAGTDEAQELFDIFFADMDRSMRENGVGDLAVPKRMKKMMTVFYADFQHYEAALDDLDKMTKAFEHTLYFDHADRGDSALKMAQYAFKQKEKLDECPLDALTSDFSFEL